MRTDRKKPQTDLRNYYTLFLEAGLIVVLLFATAVMKVDFTAEQQVLDLTKEQEVVQMEEIVQTEHVEKPPPPPPPKVPVEVPDDEVIEDRILNIDAELVLDREIELPPPPDDDKDEENFFIVVEQEPELKGGLKKLQDCANYPEMARKAGIEGRVTIQFVVNEQGRVENPRVLRGIGGGADEEALRCVRQAEFVPGRQRGKPVRVQFSLPVFFRLQN